MGVIALRQATQVCRQQSKLAAGKYPAGIGGCEYIVFGACAGVVCAQEFCFSGQFQALVASAWAIFALLYLLFCVNAEKIFRLLRRGDFERARELGDKQRKAKAMQDFEADRPHTQNTVAESQPSSEIAGKAQKAGIQTASHQLRRQRFTIIENELARPCPGVDERRACLGVRPPRAAGNN